jgi:hypothetical protein
MASASPGLVARDAGAQFRAGLALARWSALIVALAAPALSRTADAHGIAAVACECRDGALGIFLQSGG